MYSGGGYSGVGVLRWWGFSGGGGGEEQRGKSRGFRWGEGGFRWGRGVVVNGQTQGGRNGRGISPAPTLPSPESFYYFNKIVGRNKI